MRASQARKSVEVAKDIQADKTLKSKAEKERILKEKQSMNTKMFIEERKKAACKQAKRREKLKKNHDNQMNDLLKYMQTVMILHPKKFPCSLSRFGRTFFKRVFPVLFFSPWKCTRMRRSSISWPPKRCAPI